MPQLNPDHYPSQLFWLIVTFGALFYFLVKHILPQINHYMTERANIIESNLSAADEAKAQLQNMIDSYERKIREIEQQQVTIINDYVSELNANADKELEQVDKKLDAQLQEVEARLNDNFQKELAVANTRIKDIVSESVTNVINIDMKPSSIDAYVQKHINKGAN